MRLKPGQGSLQTAHPSPAMCFPSAQMSHSLQGQGQRDWLLRSPLKPQWVAMKGQSVPSGGLYLICKLSWAFGALALRSRPELGSDTKESWGR